VADAEDAAGAAAAGVAGRASFPWGVAASAGAGASSRLAARTPATAKPRVQPRLDIPHLPVQLERAYLAWLGCIQASALGLVEPSVASRGRLGGL